MVSAAKGSFGLKGRASSAELLRDELGRVVSSSLGAVEKAQRISELQKEAAKLANGYEKEGLKADLEHSRLLEIAMHGAEKYGAREFAFSPGKMAAYLIARLPKESAAALVDEALSRPGCPLSQKQKAAFCAKMQELGGDLKFSILERKFSEKLAALPLVPISPHRHEASMSARSASKEMDPEKIATVAFLRTWQVEVRMESGRSEKFFFREKELTEGRNIEGFLDRVKFYARRLGSQGEYFAASQLLEGAGRKLAALPGPSAGLGGEGGRGRTLHAANDLLEASSFCALAAKCAKIGRDDAQGRLASLDLEAVARILGEGAPASLLAFVENLHLAKNWVPPSYSMDRQCKNREGFMLLEEGMAALKDDIALALNSDERELEKISKKWQAYAATRGRTVESLCAVLAAAWEGYARASIADRNGNGGFGSLMDGIARESGMSNAQKNSMGMRYELLAIDAEIGAKKRLGGWAGMLKSWSDGMDEIAWDARRYLIAESLAAVLPAFEQESISHGLEGARKDMLRDALVLANLADLKMLESSVDAMGVPLTLGKKNRLSSLAVKTAYPGESGEIAFTHIGMVRERFLQDVGGYYCNAANEVKTGTALQKLWEGAKSGNIGKIAGAASELKPYGKDALMGIATALSFVQKGGAAPKAMFTLIGIADFEDGNFVGGAQLLASMYLLGSRNAALSAIGKAAYGKMLYDGAAGAIKGVVEVERHGATLLNIYNSMNAILYGLAMPAYHGVATRRKLALAYETFGGANAFEQNRGALARIGFAPFGAMVQMQQEPALKYRIMGNEQFVAGEGADRLAKETGEGPHGSKLGWLGGTGMVPSIRAGGRETDGGKKSARLPVWPKSKGHRRSWMESVVLPGDATPNGLATESLTKMERRVYELATLGKLTGHEIYELLRTQTEGKEGRGKKAALNTLSKLANAHLVKMGLPGESKNGDWIWGKLTEQEVQFARNALAPKARQGLAPPVVAARKSVWKYTLSWKQLKDGIVLPARDISTATFELSGAKRRMAQLIMENAHANRKLTGVDIARQARNEIGGRESVLALFKQLVELCNMDGGWVEIAAKMAGHIPVKAMRGGSRNPKKLHADPLTHRIEKYDRWEIAAKNASPAGKRILEVADGKLTGGEIVGMVAKELGITKKMARHELYALLRAANASIAVERSGEEAALGFRLEDPRAELRRDFIRDAQRPEINTYKIRTYEAAKAWEDGIGGTRNNDREIYGMAAEGLTPQEISRRLRINRRFVMSRIGWMAKPEIGLLAPTKYNQQVVRELVARSNESKISQAEMAAEPEWKTIAGQIYGIRMGRLLGTAAEGIDEKRAYGQAAKIAEFGGEPSRLLLDELHKKGIDSEAARLILATRGSGGAPLAFGIAERAAESGHYAEAIYIFGSLAGAWGYRSAECAIKVAACTARLAEALRYKNNAQAPAESRFSHLPPEVVAKVAARLANDPGLMKAARGDILERIWVKELAEYEREGKSVLGALQAVGEELKNAANENDVRMWHGGLRMFANMAASRMAKIIPEAEARFGRLDFAKEGERGVEANALRESLAAQFGEKAREWDLLHAFRRIQEGLAGARFDAAKEPRLLELRRLVGRHYLDQAHELAIMGEKEAAKNGVEGLEGLSRLGSETYVLIKLFDIQGELAQGKEWRGIGDAHRQMFEESSYGKGVRRVEYEKRTADSEIIFQAAAECAFSGKFEEARQLYLFYAQSGGNALKAARGCLGMPNGRSSAAAVAFEMARQSRYLEAATVTQLLGDGVGVLELDRALDGKIGQLTLNSRLMEAEKSRLFAPVGYDLEHNLRWQLSMIRKAQGIDTEELPKHKPRFRHQDARQEEVR